MFLNQRHSANSCKRLLQYHANGELSFAHQLSQNRLNGPVLKKKLEQEGPYDGARVVASADQISSSQMSVQFGFKDDVVEQLFDDFFLRRLPSIKAHFRNKSHKK